MSTDQTDHRADVEPSEGIHDRIGSRCTKAGCLELHDPEPEPVTVTLPRDVVEGARDALYGAIRLIRLAGNVVDAGRIEDDAIALDRALDAASATQEADQ